MAERRERHPRNGMSAYDVAREFIIATDRIRLTQVLGEEPTLTMRQQAESGRRRLDAMLLSTATSPSRAEWDAKVRRRLLGAAV